MIYDHAQLHTLNRDYDRHVNRERCECAAGQPCTQHLVRQALQTHRNAANEFDRWPGGTTNGLGSVLQCT